MLFSLALIFLIGLAASALCARLRLPGIIGMLLTGILLGPYLLNLLDPSLLAVSGDLREMALVIILLKAGLSLDLSDLKKVGRPEDGQTNGIRPSGSICPTASCCGRPQDPNPLYGRRTQRPSRNLSFFPNHRQKRPALCRSQSAGPFCPIRRHHAVPDLSLIFFSPAGNGALPQRSAVRSAVTFLREKDLNLRLFTGQAALNQFRLAAAAAGQKAVHLLAQSARVDAAVGGKGVFVIALPAGKDRGQRRAPLTEQQRIPAQILGGEPRLKGDHIVLSDIGRRLAAEQLPLQLSQLQMRLRGVILDPRHRGDNLGLFCAEQSADRPQPAGVPVGPAAPRAPRRP